LRGETEAVKTPQPLIKQGGEQRGSNFSSLKTFWFDDENATS
jgi:hypothetical protein